jgi:hypothetical protein
MQAANDPFQHAPRLMPNRAGDMRHARRWHRQGLGAYAAQRHLQRRNSSNLEAQLTWGLAGGAWWGNTAARPHPGHPLWQAGKAGM